MDKKDETIYSIPRDKIVSHLEDSKEQLLILQHLVHDQLHKEVKHEWLISTLCDSYSANYKLHSELDEMLELSSDKEKNEIYMDRSDIQIVEAILIARYYSNKEIGQYGTVSVSVH